MVGDTDPWRGTTRAGVSLALRSGSFLMASGTGGFGARSATISAIALFDLPLARRSTSA